uniref:Uncharacterized protein n=1 Tax=Solanum tuberosum TaxID=4113 RepID=M1CSV1_SOLTU
MLEKLISTKSGAHLHGVIRLFYAGEGKINVRRPYLYLFEVERWFPKDPQL